MDLFTNIELNRPKRLIYKKDLLSINNLKSIFREIRDYFAGNVTGITRDEKIAQNIMRLLFCKIYDELQTSENDLVEFGNRPNEDITEFNSRINNLFCKVQNKYSDIFEKDEQLEIPKKELSFIVSKMEDYSILDADRDIIADAFEELIGTTFRGGEGQFFTPRNIVQMMIEVLSPSASEKILDPACGSGGFLAHILKHFLKNKGKEHFIYGIDKDLFLSRLAKIYLTLLGESDYHIFCENSLEEAHKWKKDTKKHIELGKFDIVLTNPPFGAKIPVVGTNLLRQYELGYFWSKYDNQWYKNDNLREKQPPQILFIERIIQLLKDGGRAGIVLPDGIFGNPSDRYIWDFIKKHSSIIGVVSLSQEAFQPSTHTKTSILFLEKKPHNRKKIFMAIANTVGHNKNGKEIFRINKDGSFIFDKEGNKILDDETPAISSNFNKFLKNQDFSESHLGFSILTDEIKDNIFIPESYDPELKQKLLSLKKSGEFELITIGDLIKKGILQMKRGNEIGSQHYGTGNVPFIRTTDIVNWEIKIDPIKAVAEEIYEKYKILQDVSENDILFVSDGTFLIGKSAMVTKLDEKCIIQSHLRKFRLLQNQRLSPYYFFYLINSKFVQEQIEKQTFVQATLSTLGNRVLELVLPISTDQSEIEKISNEVKEIIETKCKLREKSIELIENSI